MSNDTLNKMAENARELGLDYEPVWDNLPSNKDVEDAMRLKRLSQLAERPAQQEPVTYWDLSENEMPVRPRSYDPEEHPNHVPLYTSPSPCPTCEALARTVMLDQTSHDAQRTWVGLTDCEREKLRSEADEADAGYRKLIKATEAKLREKNV